MAWIEKFESKFTKGLIMVVFIVAAIGLVVMFSLPNQNAPEEQDGLYKVYNTLNMNCMIKVQGDCVLDIGYVRQIVGTLQQYGDDESSNRIKLRQMDQLINQKIVLELNKRLGNQMNITFSPNTVDTYCRDRYKEVKKEYESENHTSYIEYPVFKNEVCRKEIDVQVPDFASKMGDIINNEDLIEEYEMTNNEVKVYYATYTFDDWLSDNAAKLDISREDLQSFYESQKKDYLSYMVIKKKRFRDTISANDAIQNVDTTFADAREERLYPNDELYKKLDIASINEGSVTQPIQLGTDYVVAQIKEMVYRTLEELNGPDRTKLKQHYVRTNKTAFLGKYKEETTAYLTRFAASAKAGSFAGAARTYGFNYSSKGNMEKLAGVTNYFTLNPASSLLSRAQDEEDKGGLYNSDTEDPLTIFYQESFNYPGMQLPNSQGYTCDNFFVAAFSLKKGEVSPVLSSGPNNSGEFFFVIQVQDKQIEEIVDDKLPDEKKIKVSQQLYMKQMAIVQSMWLDYLKDEKYKVDLKVQELYAAFSLNPNSGQQPFPGQEGG